MLTFIKGKYIITHAANINKNVEVIKQFYAKRINSDKILKKMNFTEYERLEAMLDDLYPIKAEHDLESLMLTSLQITDIIQSINKFPVVIHRLEQQGYSISSFDVQETNININIIRENMYLIQFYIPKPENYLICMAEIKTMSKKKSAEFNNFLVKNKLYSIISLFRIEVIAAPIRQSLSVVPPRIKDNIIPYMIQRYGLIPQTSFNISKKELDKKNIIINISGEQYYFNSTYVFHELSPLIGLSEKSIKSEITPHKCIATDHKNIIEINPPNLLNSNVKNISIYETFDGVMYRQLKTPFNPSRIIEGPSAIANGYNIQFNHRFEKHIGDPLINRHMDDILKEQKKHQYNDLQVKLRDTKPKNIVEEFLKHLIKQIDYDETDKILNHELKLMIAVERIRLQKKLKLAESINDFFEDIIGDRNNFILNFKRKIKIKNNLLQK